MVVLSLKLSELKRLRLTNRQKREIIKMYKRLSKIAQNHLDSIKLDTTATAYLQRKQLEDLIQSLSQESKVVAKELKSVILNNMTVMSKTTVQDINQFLNKAHLSIKGAYAHVPSEVVSSIQSGKIYKGNWTLSRAIWGADKKIQKDIRTIVAEGTAANKSAYDIAKDLELYVNPTKHKDWQWSKVYPGTSKRVDYNAQRLARTMVSHAYQQSVIQTTKDNPYIDGIKWLSQGGERTCDICKERNGKIYSPQNLPLDHPNGMCSYAPVVTKSFEQISKELAEKSSKEFNANPEIQKWREAMKGQLR